MGRGHNIPHEQGVSEDQRKLDNEQALIKECVRLRRQHGNLTA
jgi:hypothetical protein